MGKPIPEGLRQVDDLDFVCSKWKDNQDQHTITICYDDPTNENRMCEEMTFKSQDRQRVVSSLPCKRFQSDKDLKRSFGKAYKERDRTFLDMDIVDKEEEILRSSIPFDESQTHSQT